MAAVEGLGGSHACGGHLSSSCRELVEQRQITETTAGGLPRSVPSPRRPWQSEWRAAAWRKRSCPGNGRPPLIARSPPRA